jgi:hypothetical protein
VGGWNLLEQRFLFTGKQTQYANKKYGKVKLIHKWRQNIKCCALKLLLKLYTEWKDEVL